MNQPQACKVSATGLKRKHSDENQANQESKKAAMDAQERPQQLPQQQQQQAKRANFSALANTNGLIKSPLVKPASGQVKKVVIKNFKQLPKLPDNYQVRL